MNFYDILFYIIPFPQIEKKKYKLVTKKCVRKRTSACTSKIQKGGGLGKNITKVVNNLGNAMKYGGLAVVDITKFIYEVGDSFSALLEP